MKKVEPNSDCRDLVCVIFNVFVSLSVGRICCRINESGNRRPREMCELKKEKVTEEKITLQDV
jgi:hypothetical protein